MRDAWNYFQPTVTRIRGIWQIKVGVKNRLVGICCFIGLRTLVIVGLEQIGEGNWSPHSINMTKYIPYNQKPKQLTPWLTFTLQALQNLSIVNPIHAIYNGFSFAVPPLPHPSLFNSYLTTTITPISIITLSTRSTNILNTSLPPPPN